MTRTLGYRGIAAVAVAAGLCSSIGFADTLTWTGLNNTTTNWSDATKWSSDGDHTYPQAGDTARLAVSVDQWTTLQIGGGAAVGSLYAKPRWGSYRIKSDWSGTRTFSFNNSGNASVVTLTHGSNTYTGQLYMGVEGNAMNVSLANDLVINSDGTTNRHGQLTFGSHVTLTGGTALDRRTITTQALGTNSRITTSVSAAGATFVGDWVVDGISATLDMNTNAFGDASNSVTLMNGGVLDVVTLGSFSWTRDLSGTGTVKTTAGTFTVDTGSFSLAGADSTVDLLTFQGALALGGSSTINITGAIDEGDYIILTSDTGITGTFGTWNLGAGMSLVYGATDVTLHVVPEPASMALLALGGLAMMRRRR